MLLKSINVRSVLLVLTTIVFMTSCGQESRKEAEDNSDGNRNIQENSSSQNQNLKKLDIPAIESVIGIKGTENNGEYKVVVPQNDLKIMVDDFQIIPPMGLGSWVAFSPAKDGAMIMGDVVVTEEDLWPVQQEVIKQGLTITAIHNHFIRNHPNVMYMHVGGMGNETFLATKVKSVFDKVSESRGGNPADGPTTEVVNTLNTERISKILGYKGSLNRGVYKITIGRPDVNLMEHGSPVSTFMGFNTWASWQGTPEKAAVAGDFTMLENEVASVIKTLVENDIEVVAVHNHMVHEQPRIFFLHYWGIGNAEKLALGLRKALDQTNAK